MRNLLLTAVSTALMVLSGPAVPAQISENATPLASDLIETVEVSLVVLDVEVLDADGRPMPGLNKEDFTVWVGDRRWPIYSLDDFCRCEAAAEPAAGSAQETASRAQAGRSDAGAATVGDPTLPYFVLYFDFSQILESGRERLLQAARTWVEERRQPHDQAMVAAYAAGAGVRTLTWFTDDEATLLDAIDAAFENPELRDFHAEKLVQRIRSCLDCYRRCVRDCGRGPGAGGCIATCPRGCCLAEAMADASHGRRALQALENFLGALESVPGRKAVMLFTQSGTLEPARFYGPLYGDISDVPDEVGDLRVQATDAGSSAVAARASLHVAAVPAGGKLSGLGLRMATLLDDESQTMAATLAEYTGGSYSRPGQDLDAILAGAGRECCVYRIALLAPQNPSQRVRRIRVAVNDRILQARYRVRFMTPEEKWMRRARGYLARPDSALDVPLQAALVPQAGRRSRWDLGLQVSFPGDRLVLIPRGEERLGRWRIGALLTRQEDGQSWQMLADSQLRLGAPDGGVPFILHRHTLETVKPGRYRLAALVEDRNAGRFGAVETTLQVSGGETGQTVMGPVFLRGQGGVMQLDLPELGRKAGKAQRTGSGGATMLPLGSATAVQGDKLYVATWVCPGPDDTEGSETAWPQVLSWLAYEDRPRYRLPDLIRVPSGDCLRVEDLIDTSPLEPGLYTYHLRSGPASGGTAGSLVDLSAEFTVKH